jgi:hypothetical protein
MDGKPSDSSILPAFRVLREHARGVRWPALFVIVPLAGYAWYVTQQFGHSEDQSQRELGHSALVFENTVIASVKNVGDLEKGSAFFNQFLLEQPFLDLQAPCTDRALPDAIVKTRLVACRGGLQIVGIHATFRIRAANLLQELPFPESFHTLALLNQEGIVLLTADLQQPVRLRQLRLGERAAREPAFADEPPLILVDLKSALTAGAVKPGFDEARSSSSRLRAQLAGTSYQIYIQPLRLLDADKNQLLLLGLRPTADVLRQSLALDTYFLAFLLLLIVGLCLSYPFLKLWGLNRRERFRVHDLLFLFLSTGALLALGVTVTLAVDGYIRYQAMAAEILPELHAKLERDLVLELRAARRQLLAYDNCTDTLSPSVPPTESVQVEQVAWVAQSGRQLHKIVPTGKPSDLVDVGHRSYFRSIANKSLWILPGDASDTARTPFYFGPARSITDGQFYSFLSIFTAERKCRLYPEPEPTAAAVLTFSLHSLAPRPLPPSFGFALFNREGTVLYHSDQRLSLRQNLIRETGDSAHLRAVILAGGDATLDLPYDGRPHTFRVHPISSLKTPSGHNSGFLYLAVFQDLSIGRYIATHTFLSSMLWPQTFLAIWMAVGLAAASWTSRKRTPESNWRQWLWTQPLRASQYRFTVLLLIALLALALLLQVAGFYIVSLLLPFAAALAALLSTVWAPPPAAALDTPETRASAVLWHRLLIVSLGVCMSMVPAAALHQLILGHELGKLIAFEETQRANLKVDLPAATRLLLTREKVPPAWANQGGAVREKFMDTGVGIGRMAGSPMYAPQWIFDFQDRVSWMLPMRNDTAILLGGLPSKPFKPADGAWGPIPRYLPVLVVMTGFLWIFYVWTGWNARNILLSGRQVEAVPLAGLATLESAWKVLPLDEQCLLVQTAAENIGNPHLPETVVSLAAKGWLVLSPEVRPATPAIRDFLLSREQQTCQMFEKAEHIPGNEQSWRSLRKSLFIGLGIALLFLFSTQPALPFDFFGLISIVIGALGGAVKSMDHLSKWLAASGKDPAPP